MTLLIPMFILTAGTGFAWLYRLKSLQQRVSLPVFAAWIAAWPLGAFISLVFHLPKVLDGGNLTWSVEWMPTLGLSLSIYLDGLSALFGLVISGIGVLVVLYSGYYFKGEKDTWRFLTLLMVFMTSMMGVVLAGDLISLFIFWEGTSLSSFLLIGYNQDKPAQYGALKALLITGGGGIFLLIGFLLISNTAGALDFPSIFRSAEALRSSPLYLWILGLIALGAFTKSAQTPFHIWLPSAMSAPTPASTFLHSATMVKAGIYLLARLNPALGGTDAWFWLFSLVGMTTMLIGAFVGLKQNDLKALLAYSTIAQLGILVMLIGQDTEIAFKALVLGILAHALYKSALFLIAGIVDHETGTRDIRELGGLRPKMPITFSIALIAGLSMAGLPPMFGFLAKETLLATVTHPSVPVLVDWLLAFSAVFAGSLLLAQSGLFVIDTFLGKPKSDRQGHEPPFLMWFAPFIPAVLSLIISALPEPIPLAQLLAAAAQNAFGAKVKVSFALWTGINIELVLSIIAITIGIVILRFRHPFRELQTRELPHWSLDRLYDHSLQWVDRASRLVLNTQNGMLRHYLAIILAGLLFLLLTFGQLSRLGLTPHLPDFSGIDELSLLRLFSLFLAAGAALITIFLRRDFFAILALGASGFSVAVLMILEPAPDVALVQIVVDLLTVAILVLTLARIPKEQRDRAWEFTFRQARAGIVRDAILSIGIGLAVALIALNALLSRPRSSVVTPYYAASAKTQAGATDIVGAIIVDFRGMDTLIEITVFSMIGVGIYTLLRYASRYAKDRENLPPAEINRILPTLGIGGNPVSPLLQTTARLVLPIFLMIAMTHLLYGHDQPGDGFTAGVISGLGIALWYVLFGFHQTRQFLHLPKPTSFVWSGLALAIINSLLPILFGGNFFTRLDYGKMLGLPLPRGVYLTTSFLFEASIFLAVLGGILAILDALGHPQDDDPGSSEYLQKT